MKNKFLLLHIIYLMIYANDGIPNGICKKHGKYRDFCKNIYVWNSDRDVFLSLFNVTFPGVQPKDLEALQGKTIRVIADNVRRVSFEFEIYKNYGNFLSLPPLLQMLPYITSSNYSQHLGGYLGDIWAVIQDALKFKTNVTSVSYDGGLQIIEAGEADVMLAAAVVKDGLLNIEYSQPYFYNWYNIFVKQPEAKASSSSYLKTFNAQLWFFSLALFVILTMSVWLTSKFLNRAYRLEPYISIPSCFLGIVSGFINQGFDLKLCSYSGRIQIMFALIFGVVLYSAMNAVLVAQLAVFDTPFPFDSLDDIAKRRSHSLCLRTNSFVYNNFTDTNREVLPPWKDIVNTGHCLDINNQSNLPKILCENSLVILENRVVMTTIRQDNDIPCKLLRSRKKYFEKSNSFLIQKSFDERNLIDMFVKRMRSTGVLQRLELIWVRRDKLVEINNQKSPQVTMGHIDGILWMYLVMIMVSLILLAIEIYYYRYMDKQYHNTELKTIHYYK